MGKIGDTELSALVGEKVYGLTVCRNEECSGCNADIATGMRVSSECAPRLIEDGYDYASDSGLALEAALKASDALGLASVQIERGERNGSEAEIQYYDTGIGEWRSAWAYGFTAARALCFAALRAAGCEVEDDG